VHRRGIARRRLVGRLGPGGGGRSGFGLATGELDQAIDAYQLGIRNYPRHWGFHNSLATIYIDLRDMKKV
jgi:hypothetical protein